MPDKATIVLALCEMPSEFRDNKGLLDRNLCEATGYLSCPDEITEELLKDYLIKHPQLADPWVQASEDIRWHPAWGVCGPRPPHPYLPLPERNDWMVYYDSGHQHVVRGPYAGGVDEEYSFSDKYSAVACFIKKWADHITGRMKKPFPAPLNDQTDL